jgi:drug/metabolite transporter (DMT)-like permease
MSVIKFTPYISGRQRTIGLGFALASAAAFGTSGSFAGALMAVGWTPGAVVAARILAATVLLTPIALVQARGHWRRLRSSAGLVGLYGLVAVAGCQLAFFNAVRHLEVGVALLLEYLGIVLVVLWAWARHGQRPRRLTVAGIVAALIGLTLVLDPSGGLDGVGVAWGLAAAAGLALYFVASARMDPQLPPLVVAWAGMTVGALALVGSGLTGVLPVQATAADVVLFGRRVGWLVPVVGLSLLAAALAYSLGIAAARRLGARPASFAGLTEVLFAVAFAALLVGQVPNGAQLLGGLAVLVGVGLVQADAGPPDAASPDAGAADAGAADTVPPDDGAAGDGAADDGGRRRVPAGVRA